MDEVNNKTENVNCYGWDCLDIKTKWAQSYVYMMLPVFALIELICIVVDITHFSTGKEVVLTNFIINIILFAITLTTLILLIKFKKAGYFLNIALLICQSVSAVILMKNNPIEGAVSSVFSDFMMLISLWALPNIIYFYFRRGFFIKNETVKELKIKSKPLEWIVLFFKELSYGKCLRKINDYDIPTKYLKFYIFYSMPLTVFMYISMDFNSKMIIYSNILLMILSLITFYYLLKLEKRGYYLNIFLLIADLIISSINSFYIEPYYTKTIKTDSYIFLILSIIYTLITLIYFQKRKEIFGIIKK